MGDDYDETTLQSGINPTKRNKAQEIIRFIGNESSMKNQPVSLGEVLNYCEAQGFATHDVEDLIEDFLLKGSLYQPTRGNYLPS